MLYKSALHTIFKSFKLMVYQTTHFDDGNISAQPMVNGFGYIAQRIKITFTY